MRRSLTAFFGFIFAIGFSNAAEPPTLAERLAKESPAALAKAAREQGDANRGALLFFQPFLTCAKCHDGDTGPRLGPDIAQAGKEATAEYLVESILFPSREIKKGFESISVSTIDGRTVTGLLAEEKNGTLTLIDPASSQQITIPTADIESRTVGKQSLMPEGLVNMLSDRQQLLDLTKYLIEIAEGGPARARNSGQRRRPSRSPSMRRTSTTPV